MGTEAGEFAECFEKDRVSEKSSGGYTGGRGYTRTGLGSVRWGRLYPLERGARYRRTIVPFSGFISQAVRLRLTHRPQAGPCDPLWNPAFVCMQPSQRHSHKPTEHVGELRGCKRSSGGSKPERWT